MEDVISVIFLELAVICLQRLIKGFILEVHKLNMLLEH